MEGCRASSRGGGGPECQQEPESVPALQGTGMRISFFFLSVLKPGKPSHPGGQDRLLSPSSTPSCQMGSPCGWWGQFSEKGSGSQTPQIGTPRGHPSTIRPHHSCAEKVAACQGRKPPASSGAHMSSGPLAAGDSLPATGPPSRKPSVSGAASGTYVL